MRMSKQKISSGVIHKIPADVKSIVSSKQGILDVWEDISSLARNEWICWITSAKKDDTRQRRIRIMIENLSKGKRRPCCWAGCPHRNNKQ